MDIDRNAAAVVDHGDAVVDVNRDFDLVAVSGQRFVDGVVDNFENQMMQTPFAGVADVHAGPLSDRLQAFQNFDVVCFVFGVCGGFDSAIFTNRELEIFL